MSLSSDTWIYPLASLAVITLYLLHLVWRPGPRARHVHANLREDWFDAVSAQAGTEVLAVQTLRNSVMTATMIASTAALGFMGAISLAVPSLRTMLDVAISIGPPSPRTFLGFILLMLLFTTIVVNVLAIRNYTHASFVVAMPVGSPERKRWMPAGKVHLRTAGVLYSWGLRCMVLVAPMLVSLVHAGAGLVAALLVTGSLLRLERNVVTTNPIL